MPLFYYARQSSLATKEGAKLWHLSLKKVGRAVDAQQLAEVIAEKSSLTPGDVHNVIRNLMPVTVAIPVAVPTVTRERTR